MTNVGLDSCEYFFVTIPEQKQAKAYVEFLAAEKIKIYNDNALPSSLRNIRNKIKTRYFLAFIFYWQLRDCCQIF